MRWMPRADKALKKHRQLARRYAAWVAAQKREAQA